VSVTAEWGDTGCFGRVRKEPVLTRFTLNQTDGMDTDSEDALRYVQSIAV